MKKLSICLLLLFLLSSSIGFAFGQGRPRRVGDQPSTPQSTAPERTTPATTAPTRPPVLGGVKYMLVSHNTRMGAARGAVLVAEYLCRTDAL